MDSPATDVAAAVDAFVVEALQNPRHRLTVLRMELDIQRFMQNPTLHQFEFQHFPTSYLRCCAHRVAQHYGLQTVALGSIIDGLGSRVLAVKTPNTRFPAICLSQVPVQQPERESTEQIKIAIRPRPSKGSLNHPLGLARSNGARTVEERKEEYDKARARIFGSLPPSPEAESLPLMSSVEMKSPPSAEDEVLGQKDVEDSERTTKIGGSRVAIFRDREKDRSDPDYDRSYVRYARGLPVRPNYGLGACAVLQPSYVCYDTDLSHFGQLPVNQAPINYSLSNSAMNPYCAYGCTESKDPMYLQWPSPTPMTSSSFESFSGANFQVPFYQQPLSFEHTQHC